MGKTEQTQICLSDVWTITPLHPAEDGAHSLPGKKFFEWWYFEAHFDNGYYLVMAFHSRLFNVISRPAVVTAHLYGPGGQKTIEVAAFGPHATVINVGKCAVQLGASRVWDAGEYYGVHIEQGAVHAELEYRSEIAGVQVGTGALFVNPVNGQSFHWIIPLPRARVSGYLWIDGQRIAVNGVGYHDHNWGNLDLYRVIRRWTWGHVIADNHTLIFWDIVGRGATDSRVTGAILWQGAAVLPQAGQPDLHFSTSASASGANVQQLDSIRMHGPNATSGAQMTLQNQRILDEIDFAQPRSAREILRWVLEKAYFLTARVPLIGRLVKQYVGCGTYYRLLAECELQVATGAYRSPAFYEMMDFGELRS